MAVPGESRRKKTADDSLTGYRLAESPRETTLETARESRSEVSIPRRKSPAKPARLASLDAYRGFIMTMLAANGFGILAFSRISEDSPVWQKHDYDFWSRLSFHFDHPAWDSIFGTAAVSFWDLIQPAFMFMVGVSMPFSDASRRNRGDSNLSRICHALLRAVVLVLMGVFLYSLGHERTNWIFPNVLAQIGLGYFFAWLLMHADRRIQLAAFVLILSGYWALFHFNPPPADYDYAAVHASSEDGEVYEGRYAAWSKNANAAFFFDQWLLPKLRTEPQEPATQDDQPGMLWQWFFSTTEEYQTNRGGYTTLNFVPSIATTLLGIFCGQLLISLTLSGWKKLGLLLLTAAGCLLLGVAAHHFICPVVKRIWTPSWVLFSGGYVVGLLAIFYLLFDILPFRILAFPLVVVGTNSILIYMMGQTIRGWTTRNVVRTHFSGFIESVFGPKMLDPMWYAPLTENTATFLVFWLFLLWLYRQRIFLKI